jgi:hypothetical protein
MSTMSRGALRRAVAWTLPLWFWSGVAVAQQGDGDEDWGAFRVGADVGFANLENQQYLAVNAEGMVRAGPVRLDFAVPLRFNEQGFRTRDYDDPRDFMRLGRCLRLDAGDYTRGPDTYDPSCERLSWQGHGLHDRVYFSARVAPLTGITLGHGSLVYGYRNSLDLERPQLGGQVNFSLYDWGGADLFIDDITRPGLLGGRVFIRPQSLFFGENWDETPDELVIGFTALSDVSAPLHRMTAFGRGLVDSSGDALFIRDQVNVVGVDVHYMYLWNLGDRSAPQIGLFGFADYNHFLDIEDANALHAGLRFVLIDENTGWDVRAGAEYRLTGGRYLPEYFDADYTIQSQRFGLTPDALALPGVGLHTTQLEYILSRPGGFQHALQAYLSVQIPIPANGGAYNPLPIAAFLEDGEGPANASISFLAGPFQIDQLAVMGLYQRRNFDDFTDMFDLDGTLIRLLGRFYFGSPSDPPGSFGEIMQHVHIDVRYDHRFFQNPQGEFDQTHDFVATVGFSAGGS